MANKKKTTNNNSPRKRKAPAYKSFRLSKKIRHPSGKQLPGIAKLCRTALVPLKRNRKLFIGLILIHFILTVMFASGIASTVDFVSVKHNIEQTFGGHINKFGSALALFSYAISSGGVGASSNYQVFITLIFTLAIIWGIRQTLAEETVNIRRAFYQGMYPLIPFLAVLAVIGLQLIPALIGNTLLSTVLANGLAISAMEKLFWWILFILLSMLSLYMVLSSIFGLYVSTLPDMTPIKALRSARGLVLHRRVQVALRLLGLPVVLLVLYGLVMIPLIFILPIAVVPAFMLLNSFTLFFANSYLYAFYRELI